MDLKLEELDVLSEMIGWYLQEKDRQGFREKEGGPERKMYRRESG